MINRDVERSKEFTRRALLLGAGKAALFAALGTRLVWLQVVEQQKFRTLSDKNRISIRLVPAGRGEIMDRFGVPLAINTPNFRAILVPEQSPDVDETLGKLAKLIPLSEAERAEAMDEVADHKPFAPVLVKENLSWEDMAKVELRLTDLPGISIDEGESRSYPLSSATAHIIGYVGRVSKAELEAGGNDDPVMSTPGFRIGKNGVEKSFDKILRGEAGQTQAEVNVQGREIRELGRVEPKKGHRLTLTLDADLQMQTQERLAKERSAAAIVMDAHTGEVYALCSYPSFDPNIFSQGIPADLWEELLADETHPLTNKIVSGQYPPGSTFKMVTALSALEAGIDPGTRVFCPGYYTFGERRFHCWSWNRGGHGWVGFEQALCMSCDTFFYDMGRRLGVDPISKMAHRLGMGSRLGFDIPGEAAGLVPDRAWKLKATKQQWQQGETLNVAIGQGQTLATPLQLVTMIARLVNGGKAVKPTLVRSIEEVGSRIPPAEKIGFRENTMAIVRRGMVAVVADARGTAHGSMIKEAPYSMGGKTGSAQVRRITESMRAAGLAKTDNMPWKFRDHALFVGFGPVDVPQYVCAIIVEHGLHGASAAAPIARDILLSAQKRDPRRIRTVDDAEAGKKEAGK
jgi:penicillin-binding protein 2